MATITTHHRQFDTRALIVGALFIVLAVGAALAVWRIVDSDEGQATTGSASQTEAVVSNPTAPTEPVFTDEWLEAQVASRVGSFLAGDSPFTEAWLQAQVAQGQSASALDESPFTAAWLESQVAQRLSD
jgi:hypothetical protein